MWTAPLLSLTPLKLAELDALSPSDWTAWTDALVPSSLALIRSLPSPTSPSSSTWTPRKVYNQPECPTHTYSSLARTRPPAAGETGASRWHARRSTHASSFDDFRAGLLVEHSKHEQEYVHACKEAREIKAYVPGEVEDSNAPASPRDFTFLLLTRDVPPSSPSAPRVFVVVSIPVDQAREKGYERGRYVSVEYVEEQEGGGVVWSMAVASDAGGWVPKFLSERVMPSKIAEDVPSFLSWLEKRRGSSG
ncbi:hypothetical protein JCM10207_008303 [Rhodosporidiobolus poonsookiae]